MFIYFFLKIFPVQFYFFLIQKIRNKKTIINPNFYKNSKTFYFYL